MRMLWDKRLYYPGNDSLVEDNDDTPANYCWLCAVIENANIFEGIENEVISFEVIQKLFRIKSAF